MKAFVIHTHHAKSVAYAEITMDSFAEHDGWEPELFLGYTPDTVPDFKVKPKSRAAAFQRQGDPAFKYKKSCSLNHYRLFNRCVEIGEPIAVIEHDAMCKASWSDPDWDDVLVLNINSAISNSWTATEGYWPESYGINDIDIDTYRHDPAINGSKIMLGTAAYAVTPQGATKMVAAYADGWGQ